MEDQDDEYQSQMREELSHIPLGQLKAMQNKLGLKAFNKMKTGSPQKKTSDREAYKRLNKHRPSEFSSRKPVPREKVTNPKKTTRDPRFDDLSGEFNGEIFKTSYGFLDEIKTKEKHALKKIIEETKNRKQKGQLKDLYKRMEHREKAEKKQEKLKAMEKEWKKEERQKVLEGKKPYFLKQSEKKARIKEQHMKELEESGKMQKYTERKNKKIAAKEKKRHVWKTDSV